LDTPPTFVMKEVRVPKTPVSGCWRFCGMVTTSFLPNLPAALRS